MFLKVNFNRENDDLAWYKKQIFSIPSLSFEEERALLRQWQEEGRVEARNKVIESHLKQAFRYACRYRRFGLPLGDLVAEANTGLFSAANKFNLDAADTIRFLHKARYEMREPVQSYIVNNWHAVALPAKHRKFFFAALRTQQLTPPQTGQRENMIKVAKRDCGISRDLALHIYNTFIEKRLSPVDTLEMTYDGEENAHNPNGFILRDSAKSLEEELAEQQEYNNRIERLRAALNTLTPQEYYVFKGKWLEDKPLNNHAMAKTLGCGHNKISEIRAKAEQRVMVAVLAMNDNFNVIMDTKQRKSGGLSIGA